MQRPNRVLMWALAMFVYQLESGTQPALDHPGAEVFETHCAGCHHPDAAFGGGLVQADLINSDQAAAGSLDRGTGLYKVPTLVGASHAGRFLHDASLDSLEDVVDSGHPFGETIAADERVRLLQFLQTL